MTSEIRGRQLPSEYPRVPPTRGLWPRLPGGEQALRSGEDPAPGSVLQTPPPGPQLPAGQGGTQTPPSLFSSWNLTLWMASGRASSRVSSSASSSVSGRASG